MSDRQPDDLTSFWERLARHADDLVGVCEAVVEWAARTVGEGAVLTVLSADGTELEPGAAYHPDPEVRSFMRAVLSAGSFPLGQGIAGSVAAERRPAVIGGIDPGIVADLVEPSSRGFAESHPIHALVVVPMVDRGELVGTLGAARLRSVEPYGDRDVRALEAIAERAAIAIRAARGSVPNPLGAAEYEAIYRHSMDGVLFTVPDGRILAANPAACAILRLSEVEICRLGRAGLLLADDPVTRQAVEERARTGRVRAEIPMRRGTGEVFVADMSSVVFLTADGEPRACVIFRDVTPQAAQRAELHRQAVELSQQSSHDVLTELHNRRGFTAAAGEALRIADRAGASVQLAYFDMDRLKLVNDSLGHRAGDALLRRFADALRVVTRESDVSGRIGGDEFVLLLYAAEHDDGERVVDRVTAELDASDEGPLVSFSVGIASRSAGSGTDLDQLIDAADAAMYEAKVRRRFTRDPGA
jgi:diguanylate cyclase (GGDEF)-like protein/PAS domain S-box-containing protein